MVTHRVHHHPCYKWWRTDFPQPGFPVTCGMSVVLSQHPNNHPSQYTGMARVWLTGRKDS